MRKKLIVNADDFGYSTAVNQAIIKAFDQGILTSCSLMVGEEAFSEAVELAKSRPKLAVGLHLVLICGRAVLPASEIPNLVDSKGNFPLDPFSTGVKYYFSSAAQKELRKEIYAQVEKFASTGLAFSHIDGHLHLHMHPTVFAILAEAAEKFGVKRVRLPRETLIHTLKLRRANLAMKIVWWLVFHLLSVHAKKLLENRGFNSVDRVYGLLESGSMTEDFWLGILPQIKTEFSEIYSHPEISALALNSTNLRGNEELTALLSEKVRNKLNEHSFELINYFDLDKINKINKLKN
ncbi:MAG: hopanoid biosynthesis-associated protein HpnK [Acidobacteria bacterium]|nr:hopanoid biosynthesis-associated protein HpnK [Acidobacteriota bacterium]